MKIFKIFEYFETVELIYMPFIECNEKFYHINILKLEYIPSMTYFHLFTQYKFTEYSQNEGNSYKLI